MKAKSVTALLVAIGLLLTGLTITTPHASADVVEETIEHLWSLIYEKYSENPDTLAAKNSHLRGCYNINTRKKGVTLPEGATRKKVRGKGTSALYVYTLAYGYPITLCNEEQCWVPDETDFEKDILFKFGICYVGKILQARCYGLDDHKVTMNNETITLSVLVNTSSKYKDSGINPDWDVGTTWVSNTIPRPKKYISPENVTINITDCDAGSIIRSEIFNQTKNPFGFRLETRHYERDTTLYENIRELSGIPVNKRWVNKTGYIEVRYYKDYFEIMKNERGLTYGQLERQTVPKVSSNILRFNQNESGEIYASGKFTITKFSVFTPFGEKTVIHNESDYFVYLPTDWPCYVDAILPDETQTKIAIWPESYGPLNIFNGSRFNITNISILEDENRSAEYVADFGKRDVYQGELKVIHQDNSVTTYSVVFTEVINSGLTSVHAGTTLNICGITGGKTGPENGNKVIYEFPESMTEEDIDVVIIVIGSLIVLGYAFYRMLKE